MSAGALLDPAWFRVAELRPRLRAHVRLHRHRYRGDVWYVLQDASTGRFHRFSPAAWRFIGLLDGQRSVREAWASVGEALGDDAPTQPEAMRLLFQLHAADALQGDVPPDAEEMLRRFERNRRARWLQGIRSPLAIRIPLLDPERCLRVIEPLLRPLLGRLGGLVWLVVVAGALALAVLHWPELTHDVGARILTPQNLVLLWLAFPIVKLCHELGHGLLVKRWGGEVHQLGIMLLVLAPVPYVDATDSSAFASKYRRAAVGAAGMLVELFLAALAMFVWVLVEPGLARTLAFDVMFIAGVSTVLFNANPLLRFDGYYVLSDLTEIPNLAGRSNRYLQYIARRYLLGVTEAESPAMARGERGWLAVYGVAAFFYRLFVYTIIVVFIASKFFVIGVLLALWATFSTIVLPLGKALRYLLTGDELERGRLRAVGAAASVAAALVGAVALLPLPLATVAEGVVFVPEHAVLRAGATGTVSAVSAASGAQVSLGEPLLTLDDPLLPAEASVRRQALVAARTRHAYFRHTDPVQAAITREAIDAHVAALERTQSRRAALRLNSPADGRLALLDGQDMHGRYVQRGERLGYVVTAGPARVRAVVTQAEIDLLRTRTTGVEARFADALGTKHRARVLRVAPAGKTRLASAALGTSAGGRVPVTPADASGETSVEPVFGIDLEVPGVDAASRIGARVHLRFDHGDEALAGRWYRDLRRLLLSHFEV